MSTLSAEVSESPSLQKASDQERPEDDAGRIEEFLARLTMLSCECGVFVTQDVNDKLVVLFMEHEDFADSYALNSIGELTRRNLSMEA